ncbi:MAG: NAD-dependent epimerase/dehydratase family protein [Firmicutes bacterium]|nr:NAD-dependent epimerase/dehydratase family protein [Bacillota bacterium]
MRNVLVTGATGFLGQEVSQRLMRMGYRVVGLTRSVRDNLAVIPMVGDLLVDAPFVGPDLPFEAVIHCAGHHPGETNQVEPLHEEGTRRIVDEAMRRGIRRFIYISAMGASFQAPTRFQRSKWVGEQIVVNAGLDYTILRPHLMFGQGSRTFQRLEEAASRPWAVLPESKPLIQPVYVGDVAEIALRSLWLDRTVGQIYDIGGPQSMNLEDVVRHIARDIHLFRLLTVRIPKRYAYYVLHKLGRVGPILTGEEWEFLQHEVTRQDSRWLIDYGILPHSLAIYYSPLT